jgi:lactoylglutathione lyase
MRSPRLAHVALWATDLDRLVRFYVALGGVAGARYHNPQSGFSSCFVAFGDGPPLEVMHRADLAPGAAEPARGWAHVALTVGDRAAVDRAVADLRRSGVPILSGPRVTGDDYYEAVIADPEGNRVELVAGA